MQGLPSEIAVGNCGHCTNQLMKDAADLINQQKAEIESLRKRLSHTIVVDKSGDNIGIGLWERKSKKAEDLRNDKT